MGFLNGIIRRSLGGSYKQELVDPIFDECKEDSRNEREEEHDDKEKLPQRRKRVAVIGGGLAGLTAAIQLLEKGFHVVIYESNDYVGGKCGAWPFPQKETHDDTTTTTTTNMMKEVYVSHGFHGIFPQYYNCRNLLKKVGIMPNMTRKAEDYVILRKNEKQISFAKLTTTPLISMFSLWRLGVYKLYPIITSPKRIRYLMETIRYSPTRTVRKFNDMSFQQWCDECKLPQDLVIMFTAITRSFFADPEDISMANLIEAFHFYFTSNDGGLIYDIFVNDYHQSFCQPMTQYIENLGGIIYKNTPVKALSVLPSSTSSSSGSDYPSDARNQTIEISTQSKDNGNANYDYAVLACDPTGVQKILSSSTSLQRLCPEFVDQVLSNVRVGERYSVLKLWMDRRIHNEDQYPPYFMTEKLQVMDSVALTHEYESCGKRWVETRTSGQAAVYELHCYAVPKEIPNDRVEELFLQDLFHFFPELQGATILEKSMMIDQNFTAFHKGLQKNRPGTDTPIECLKLAGDWVKLPTTAKLMEGAVISGMMAANHILYANGEETDTIYCVPERGMLTRRPRKKTKKKQKKTK